MHRHLLWTVVLSAVCFAADDRIGPRDEFSTAEGWAASNRNAPGKVECDGERLILTDLPGGKATWGTSCFKSFTVDMDKYRFLVVKVDKMTKGFSSKITGRGGKFGILRGLKEPGIVVEDIAARSGWSGQIKVSLGLYASGAESSIAVDYVRFVSSLNAQERAAMTQAEVEKGVPFSGLKQLALREGPRPGPSEPPYLSERLIYMDPATHAWVWRMTSHPAIERHEYYDIPAWNADGSLLTFLSRRAPRGYWLMDADGANIRPFPKPADGEAFSVPRWSSLDPAKVFFSRSDEGKTSVMAMDVRTGQVTEVVSVPVPGLRMEPPHPDDRHFLLRRGNTHLWVVDGETGKLTDFETWPTHRRRFTKAPDLSIFINRDFDPETPKVKRRTSWVCDRDGANLRMIMDGPGGHPDWAYDGSALAIYAGGGIQIVPRDGGEPRLLVASGGGHGGWSFDSQWHVSDASHGGPYHDRIFVTKIDGSRIHPICFHNSSYQGWSAKVPDPEATHPAPICSPDQTKIVYDSDMMGQPDVWVALWQFPARPWQLRAKQDDGDVVLEWHRPERSKELAGYNVYRRHIGDAEFSRIATRVDAPGFADRDGSLKTHDYAVSCQEHSGLESPMSIAWGGERRVFVIEPEQLAMPEGAGIVLDQRVAGGFYVTTADAPKPAKLDLGNPALGAGGGCTLWARACAAGKGETGWSAILGDEEVAGPKPEKEWSWQCVRFKGRGGDLAIVALPGLSVDQMLLTTDEAMAPMGIVGRPQVAPAAPSGLSATADGANGAKLAWKPVSGAHHYNVYATREPSLDRGNATLVGTPTEPQFVDAGLVPRSTYRYQVTTADVWGNESQPTRLAGVETASKPWLYLHVPARAARLEPPMAWVEDDACASRGYLHVPDEHSNAKYVYDAAAHMEIEVPADDDYVIWARTMGLDGKSDSFFIAVDDGEKQQWAVGRSKGEPEWQWARIEALMPARLSAGKHVLHVHSREDGTRLDKLIVTNDPFFVPVQLQPEMKRGELLYSNEFASDAALDGWVLEGAVRGRARDGKLYLEAFDEAAAKGVAWCPEVFDDPIEISYRLRPLTEHGLCIIFFMAEGRKGEDIFTWQRDGKFEHYIRGRMNAYHISYHRDFTDGCNIRKNYGFHLVAETLDPCRGKDKDYQITVRKSGGHVQFLVDGRLVHNWFDDGAQGGPPHTRGKIGLRHTRKMSALYSDLRVFRLVGD